MTLKDFQNRPDLRDGLRQALDLPILQTAIGLAKRKFEARTGVADGNPVIATSLYHQQAGVNEFLRTLEELTETPAPPRKQPALPSLAKSEKDLPPEQS